MPFGSVWTTYLEDDVRALVGRVLERGERIEQLAVGYERAGWKDLAWTAVRSALVAGLLQVPYGQDEKLGQTQAVALTNRRLVFIACRGALDWEERRGKLVREDASAVRLDALTDDSFDGRVTDGHVTLCVETQTLRRSVFFEPVALPQNLERSRRILEALRAKARSTRA